MHRRYVVLALLAIACLVIWTGGLVISPDTRSERVERTAPDPRYYTYEEVLAEFDAYALQYPDIFHREIIGYTGVGHEPIWAAKISDNASVAESEPRVLIHAALHANELNGTGAIMHMMKRLLTNYGHNGYYTGLVNGLEIWFVPMLNVDGIRQVYAGLEEWEWIRKTTRDNDHNGYYTYPEDGVDPNRNWDYRWAEYDSTDYRSSRYKGPYPFSEACVVTMRDFILRERPVILMDLHSPDVPSIGNKIWWTWYDPNTWQQSVDGDIYKPISQALGYNTLTEGGGYYNGNGAAYNTLPKEQCWVYKNTGGCALLMEISLQYWWTGAMVDTIAHRVGRGLFYLLEKAQAGPGLTGTVTNSVTGQPVIADIRVNQFHDPAIGPRLTEASHGRYWRFLPSGSYSMSVTAEGYDTEYANVYVSSSGWTVRDFQLQPDPASAGDEPGQNPGDVLGAERVRMVWAETPLARGGAVHFRLSEPAEAQLEMVDASGRRVALLASGRMGAGLHSARLREHVSAGSYFLRLRAGGGEWTTKLLVVD